MATKSNDSSEIRIERLQRATIKVHVLGTSPLILHRMADKALHELLLPAGRRTAADRAQTLKHNPIEEYRAAALTVPSGPTLLGLLSTAFKGAMMTAALAVPGVRKTEIGRLVFVEGESVPVYGEPRLFMSVVRSADMNRTPDIRTRPIVPRWAAELLVTFVAPLITEQSVVNLLAAAGVTAGVGDWRPEKGKGSYGQFDVVNADDVDYAALVAEGGRAVQERALAEPEPYNTESAELLDWFTDEAGRRGRLKVVAS